MTALFCAVVFSFSVHGNDLSKIQLQIKQQEQKIAEQKREQNKLQSTLKNQETQINGVLGQLRQTEAELKEIRRLMTETDKQIKQLEKQEKDQKDKLAKQVDAMYRAGVNPSTFEKLLSEDAQKAERMKVYYEHMNLARLELIEDLKATQLRLEQDKTLIQSQQKEQQSQLAAQKKTTARIAKSTT